MFQYDRGGYELVAVLNGIVMMIVEVATIDITDWHVRRRAAI